MQRRRYGLGLLACGLLLAGCQRASSPTGGPGAPALPLPAPLAGKWIGEAKLATGNDLTKLKNALSGGKMTGESSLILNADGTGFLKVADQAEKPVSWKQDGRKVILQSPAKESGSASGEKAGESNSMVGTLSEDEKTLSLDLGEVKVVLTKQPGGGG